MRNRQAKFSHPNLSPILRRALRASERGRFDNAERLLTTLLEVHPNNFDLLHGLGQINYRAGCLDRALAFFQAALKTDLGRADGFASLGLVFHSLQQFGRALASYEEGLRIEPNNPELLNLRGVALLDLGRPHEAIAYFARLLESDPDNLDALGNYGNALIKLNRPAQALAAYDRALACAGENAQLLTNRAVALRRLDRPREAAMSAARALVLRPDFAEARFVESVARLTLGDFRAGWRGYEARWAIGSLALQRRTFTMPHWSGEEPLDGKTILLHAEQGFGDTIQFVRYARMVVARGATVILEVQPQLVRLLSRLPGVEAVIARGEPLPRFDCHCPLLSLPLAFATDLAHIPASIPYILPPAGDVALWRARLPLRRPLVGLVWSGERSHDNDLNRSIPLATLAPLLDAADVAFVSLQHDVRGADAAFLQGRSELLHVGAQFKDFAHTAAVLALLDIVISVDTAVAHLAGAMGKPLFLLLPFAADFRWLRERQDSPWYPTARLFRQPKFGDWQSVVEAVRCELMQAVNFRSARKLSA